MKLVIIGSVAAGTSVAAKARRNDEEIDIIIFEKDTDISYSGCGLPYYIGEDYIQRDNLTPRNPGWFKDRFNIDIFTAHEVTGIDTSNKVLTVLNVLDGSKRQESYDKLVIATGAEPFVPEINGVDNSNVFTLRNVKSADRINEFIKSNNVKDAVILGAGYIGLELTENLVKRKINTTIVELQDRVMSTLDADMSVYLEDYLGKSGVNLILGEKVTEILDNGSVVVTSSGRRVKADMIIVAAGVRPNVKLAKAIGVELGSHNAIKVNNKMETNLKDIYAAGDCCESYCRLTGREIYVPLGSTANKMGRILGDTLTGGTLEFKGILGTGIFKVFDLGVARTGLTEKEALDLGYDVEVIHNIKEDKSKYLKESTQIVIKAVADRSSGRLLGVQVVGESGVDKRVDVFATLITYGATVDELFSLDLAYAPPFATTKDPVLYTGMVLDNAINNQRKLITVDELYNNRSDYIVIDVRSLKDYEKGHIENAVNIPLARLRESSKEFSVDDKIVVHCNKGVTGNAAQNIMINMGFKNVFNLSGGYKNYKMQLKRLK